MTVTPIRIHSEDPRLKRRINHDPQSWDYKLDISGLSIADVEWSMHIPTMDQGSVGKCTAEAACENLASDPFWTTLPIETTTLLGDQWTDGFYSDEETLDGDGPFPPNDNGSDGLTSAKVAKARGLISGYTHTFTAEDALRGLQLSPFSWGTLWKTGMDNVDTVTGQVAYSGDTRGGHEMSAYKIVADLEQLWVRQSWGRWGYQGSGVFWISFADFEKSLADQGDATFFTPLSQPAPVPTPDPTPAAFPFAEVDPWADSPHVWRKATAAAKAYKNWRGAR